MADIRYNVGQLFKQAFGVNSPVFLTEPLNKETPADINFKGLEILPDYYQPDATSWMGTPIIFQAKFLGGNYKKFDQGLIKRTQMDDFVLPAATMFSFRRAKDIIRTKVAGSDGTVKEIYTFDDWVIDVRGLCLDEPSKSAREQIEQLLKWEKLADSIAVDGSQFNLRNITRVCLNDWADDIPMGKPGVISFQFQLIGDEPLELALRV